MKINYAVILGNIDGSNLEVKHMCLYEGQPTKDDYESLIKEVATDQAFGMVGDNSYNIYTLSRLVPGDKEIMDILRLPDEI